MLESSSSDRAGGPAPVRTRWGAWVALVLVAITLRGPVSSVGPLLGELRSDLGLQGVAAALLPALPLLCFGLLAPVAPSLAGRLGLHRAVLAGSAVLAVGISVRGAGAVGLFGGTVLVGAGITVVNVLVPAVLKADFSDRLPLATALATSAISLSAGLGAGLAQPLRDLTGGSTTSLAVWLIPAFAATAAWTRLGWRHEHRTGPRAAGRVLALLSDRVALSVTAFFGLQSLAFYSVLAWLPSVLGEAGVSSADAGVMLAVAALLGAPASFVVPRLASRGSGQGAWAVLVSVPSLLGLTGLLIAPAAAPWVWSLLIGAGTGAAFPLALTLVLLRSRDSEQAARLSAAAQSAGYCIAAAGPFVVGLLHDAAGSWTPSLLLLVILLVVQLLTGVAAGRDRLVER